MTRLTGMIAITVLAVLQVCAAGEGGTVFKEDFSRYDVGDPVTDWGTTDIIVLKTPDDKTWIQSQSPGIHKAEKRLRLPDNFILTFNYIYEKNSFEFLFIDNNESTHILSFTAENYATPYMTIQFQDTISNSVTMEPYSVQGVKIVRKNKTFRLFINDSFVLSSTPGGFGATRGLAFKIEPTTKIGNIEIRELVMD
jgi:hypothetical protein